MNSHGSPKQFQNNFTTEIPHLRVDSYFPNYHVIQYSIKIGSKFHEPFQRAMMLSTIFIFKVAFILKIAKDMSIRNVNIVDIDHIDPTKYTNLQPVLILISTIFTFQLMEITIFVVREKNVTLAR